MITLLETVHRARIHYDIETDDPTSARFYGFLGKVQNKAFNTAQALSLECETNSGGICWGPYITLEGKDRAAVAQAAGTIERYIQRWRGARVEPPEEVAQ